MLDFDTKICGDFLVFHLIKYSIVVDRTVLQDFNKGGTAMSMGAFDCRRQMFCFSVD